ILGIFLGILSIFRDIRVGKHVELTPGDKDGWRERTRVVAASIAWIIGFIWLIFLFGMLIGTVVFSIIFLLVVARMRPIPTVIYTACIGAVIWVLAEYAHLVMSAGYLLFLYNCTDRRTHNSWLCESFLVVYCFSGLPRDRASVQRFLHHHGQCHHAGTYW